MKVFPELMHEDYSCQRGMETHPVRFGFLAKLQYSFLVGMFSVI